jgi:Zn finger protein HypA/HybF involved in hydrogenase expression
MLTFATECLFPFLCKGCDFIVQANALEENASCPKCGSSDLMSYADESLCGQKGDEIVVGWSPFGREGMDFDLHNGRYWCPSCKTFRLQFKEGQILWD